MKTITCIFVVVVLICSSGCGQTIVYTSADNPYLNNGYSGVAYTTTNSGNSTTTEGNVNVETEIE